MATVYTPSTPLNWSWVTLSGLDAPDFLHRLTTVHVRALRPGQGAPGSFLTPQGKLRAYFHLWRTDEKDFGFELDAGQSGYWKQELLAVIDQFTFGEKMELKAELPLASRWILLEPGESVPEVLSIASGEQTTGAASDGIRICRHADSQFGRPWFTVWGSPEKLESWTSHHFAGASSVTHATLEAWRIENVAPWVDHEITSEVNPLEVGLRNAIADNKGCYPGQEVIEKIVALGSPAKRLILTAIDGEAELGSKLLSAAEPPQEVGSLTSVARTVDGWRALAIIRKTHAKEGLETRLPSGTHGKILKVAPYELEPESS